jgi:hypothetical protein
LNTESLCNAGLGRIKERRISSLFYYWHIKLRFCVYYSGELTREEDVLEWLVQNKSTGDEEDVIEDVTAKALDTLIGSVDNLVVLFCKLVLYFRILKEI